jgi:hypothetical protein
VVRVTLSAITAYFLSNDAVKIEEALQTKIKVHFMISTDLSVLLIIRVRVLLPRSSRRIIDVAIFAWINFESQKQRLNL